MTPEQINEQQARRFAFLRLMYERGRGDLRMQHDNIAGMRCQQGLDQRELDCIIQYWVAKGCGRSFVRIGEGLCKQRVSEKINRGKILAVKVGCWNSFHVDRNVNDLENFLRPECSQIFEGDR